MFEKIEDVTPSLQQEIYHSLLNKYEKALYSLGMDDEEVGNELSEYIQFYSIFTKQ